MQSSDPGNTSPIDVLHAGDIWWNSHYLFIDHSSGGTIDGMISAVTQLLALGTNKTFIIPGHGPAGK